MEGECREWLVIAIFIGLIWFAILVALNEGGEG